MQIEHHVRYLRCSSRAFYPSLAVGADPTIVLEWRWSGRFPLLERKNTGAKAEGY